MTYKIYPAILFAIFLIILFSLGYQLIAFALSLGWIIQLVRTVLIMHIDMVKNNLIDSENNEKFATEIFRVSDQNSNLQNSIEELELRLFRLENKD